jgi:hypothetical protein
MEKKREITAAACMGIRCTCTGIKRPKAINRKFRGDRECSGLREAPFLDR